MNILSLKICKKSPAVYQIAFGFWLLAFGFWLLAFGFWLLAFGFWLLAFGFWQKINHVCKIQVFSALFFYMALNLQNRKITSPIAHRPSPIAHRPSPIAHRPSPT